MSIEIREMTLEDLNKMKDEHERLNPDIEIRQDIKQALDEYALYGHPLGGFLTAVVENDLMGAFGKADSYNRATLFQICQYLYNSMPADSHGSAEIVKRYRERFRKEKEDS